MFFVKESKNDLGTFPNKDTVFEFYVDTNNRTWLHWEEQLKDEWIYNSEYFLTYILLNLTPKF